MAGALRGFEARGQAAAGTVSGSAEQGAGIKAGHRRLTAVKDTQHLSVLSIPDNLVLNSILFSNP